MLAGFSQERARTVWVEHGAGECNGGWLVGVLLGEGERELEGAALPGGLLGPKDHSVPHEDVRLRGRSCYSHRGVVLQPLHVSHQPFSCRRRHPPSLPEIRAARPPRRQRAIADGFSSRWSSDQTVRGKCLHAGVTTETAAFETFAEGRCRESFAFGSCVALLSSPRVAREAQTVALLRLRGARPERFRRGGRAGYGCDQAGAGGSRWRLGRDNPMRKPRSRVALPGRSIAAFAAAAVNMGARSAEAGEEGGTERIADE